jgi:hypothetical protein
MATTCPPENYTIKLNTGQVDPTLGMSYIQFAMEGLRHQLSQGAGGWSVEPGDRYTYYKLVESVLPSTVDKDGHEKDFFDGIDTSCRGWLQGSGRRIRRFRSCVPGWSRLLSKSRQPVCLAKTSARRHSRCLKRYRHLILSFFV